ncbi:hypothetical protein KTT_04580 [Tengunoibacter tsumagoiensis]|uniref:Uncharacterized protein n=1 Tax=Tengunoibacter tsumagoiensis TaxID=2014871 RepID=A0A401ZUK6_9CHLR|nr:hypothetical protein KTT_04580 [Tengunoibacter tsumagoiensis]
MADPDTAKQQVGLSGLWQCQKQKQYAQQQTCVPQDLPPGDRLISKYASTMT